MASMRISCQLMEWEVEDLQAQNTDLYKVAGGVAVLPEWVGL